MYRWIHLSIGVCLRAVFREILAITGWNPSVYKSNRLHVHILRFSFVKLGVYSIDSSKMIDNFHVDFNFNRLFLKLNRFICI